MNKEAEAEREREFDENANFIQRESEKLFLVNFISEPRFCRRQRKRRRRSPANQEARLEKLLIVGLGDTNKMYVDMRL